MRFCPDSRQSDLNPRFDLQPVWMSALVFGRRSRATKRVLPQTHANLLLQVCTKSASFRPEKVPKVLIKLLRLVEPWEMTGAINEQQG